MGISFQLLQVLLTFLLPILRIHASGNGMHSGCASATRRAKSLQNIASGLTLTSWIDSDCILQHIFAYIAAWDKAVGFSIVPRLLCRWLAYTSPQLIQCI